MTTREAWQVSTSTAWWEPGRMHAEREAVLENIGMGAANGWLRVVLYSVVALLVVGAIYGLLVLTLR